MTDSVQDGLLAWSRGERGAEVEHALDALAREWRPRVRRFLQGPSPDEVESWLSAALLALAVERDVDGRPRAAAPEGAESPRAWRRTVLRNHLVSESRKGKRRRHVEAALRDGLGATAEHEAWRRGREARAAEKAGGLRSSEASTGALSEPLAVPVGAATSEAAPLRGMDRRAVWSVLGDLAVLRAVTLVLALRGDPSPFAEALAKHRKEPVGGVLQRMRAAMGAPPDGVHDHLTMAMVRVGWPDGEDRKALDSARKSLQRAIGDVKRLLAREDR